MSRLFKEQALAGRGAFVAGGTSGINLVIAEALAEAGADVAVLSRSQDKVDAAVERLSAANPKAAGFAADVREYDAVSDAMDAAKAKFGRLDIIVSGAAGNFVAPAGQLSSNGFKAVVDIDLLGTFNVLRAAYDRVEKAGASMISISAPQSTQAYWGQAHVCAAKAGVDMLTRCLASEWGPEGIRVNAVVPGPIDGTEGMARLAPTPEMRAVVEQSVALKRYGEKADVADMAVFLASEAARYVTGSVLYCDGGQVLSGGGALHPDRFMAAAE